LLTRYGRPMPQKSKSVAASAGGRNYGGGRRRLGDGSRISMMRVEDVVEEAESVQC
jgi:hypothetical protein